MLWPKPKPRRPDIKNLNRQTNGYFMSHSKILEKFGQTHQKKKINSANKSRPNYT